MGKGNYIWISVVLEAETDLAWMVDAGTTTKDPNNERIWLPKSQIRDYSEETYESGDCIEIEIPEWLALDKGLI